MTESAPSLSASTTPGTIVLLHGPNLNLLGTREPDVYGQTTLADVEALCQEQARLIGLRVQAQQTNHEGQFLDWIHDAGRRHAVGEVRGVIMNAGAWTHTSVAIRDAITGSGVPVVEVHISNVHAREEFRHHSYISAVARGVIVGFGVDGYRLAVQSFALAR